jgi:GNAT superfamily N-acetyltransferase
MPHAACLKAQSDGKGVYFAAWDGETPIGRLFLAWTNNEIPRILDSRPHAYRFTQSPEIRDVYVAENRRSGGIGTLLIHEAVRQAEMRGATDVTLCVETENPRALALYERLGFEEPGIGVFTTTGTYIDGDGNEVQWQNGPQVLLARSSARRA